MEIVAHIENVVFQHGAARAIHGWFRGGFDIAYLAGEGGGKALLFKLVYRFPRTAISEREAQLEGFLAEVVYGEGQFKALILAASLDRSHWLAADRDGALLGHASCAPAASAALSAPRAAA